ncbi:MAG: CBS domain-containing protein [Alcaligenaceae bacterium]|nr:CBS domain-containing protein [Alcaligenaceae bacterium]
MSTDPYPSSEADPESKSAKKNISRTLLQRLKSLLGQSEPEDREDIQEILSTAHEKEILDDDSYTMVLGSISFAEKSVSDIMVPRSRMDMLDASQTLQELLPMIIDTAHSRFPVYENERDNIIGILLAKDLLRLFSDQDLDYHKLIRPAYFVPETKKLNQLLADFKETRNHIAIVIDEYGSVTGLLTMEDLLEQIVGDIEDEYDEDAEQTIFPESDIAWRVMAITDIKDFNQTIHTNISDEEYDTIGGWLAAELDHIPQRGDVYDYDNLRFRVLRADARRALWLHVKRLPAPGVSETNN